MALPWTLTKIRAKVRKLTGRRSTSQISDDDLDDYINDYYRNKFPTEVDLDQFRGYLTQRLSATDSGEYLIEDSDSILKLEKPARVNGIEIDFYMDEDNFLLEYPKDTGSAFVINEDGAGLAIGTADTTAVQNVNAFDYDISRNSYYLAAATETSLSGSNVPQNKYGAFRLEVASDGTVSVVEADDNSTGYNTPALAVQGLAGTSTLRSTSLSFTSGGTYEVVVGNRIIGATSAASGTVTAVSLTSGSWAAGTAAGTLSLTAQTGVFLSENIDVGSNTNVASTTGNASSSSDGTKAPMGYVTVMNTAGVFDPGTTVLSAATVTATYTDGWDTSRQTPMAVLLRENTLFVRPKSDEWKELSIPCTKKPTELTLDSSLVLEQLQGSAVAYGAAIDIMAEDKNIDEAMALTLMHDDILSKINGKYTKQKGRVRSTQASF